MIGPSKPTQQCLQSPYLRRHSGPYIDTRDELTPALHGSKSLVRVVLILHTSQTGAGIHMDPALKNNAGPWMDTSILVGWFLEMLGDRATSEVSSVFQELRPAPET